MQTISQKLNNMQRYALGIEYISTSTKQKQKKTNLTIQEKIEESLSRLQMKV